MASVTIIVRGLTLTVNYELIADGLGNCGLNNLRYIRIPPGIRPAGVDGDTFDKETWQAFYNALMALKHVGSLTLDRPTIMNDAICKTGGLVRHVLEDSSLTADFAEWLCQNAERLGICIVESPVMINKNYQSPEGIHFIKQWIWDPTGSYILDYDKGQVHGKARSFKELKARHVQLWEATYTRAPDNQAIGRFGITLKKDATPWFQQAGLDVKKHDFNDLVEGKLKLIKNKKFA